ncbi:MAG: CocE/NonD family hydrolase, partial [Anaerolineales bacterium]|nr:CocE/NonD family hydrolase [Anaerolineales bacterium]
MNRRAWGVGATAVLAAIGLRRQLLGRALGLPPVAYRVRVRRGVAVTMSDGVRLLADHYAPQTAVPQPAILIRTPYGRRLLNAVYAQRFAERGYHVLCQDVRGRFGSAGTFEPYVAERADGAATIAWLARQPWCNGRVGMWGQSYVGYVQWAAAAAAPEALQAVVPAITQSDLAIGRVDGLQLDRMLRWLVQLDALDANVAGLPGWERLRRLTQAAAQDALVARGASRLPLADADLAMFDQPVPFFRTWLRHPDPADDYWAAVDFSRAVGRVTAPAHLVAGWHDIFLDGQLADYAALRANGRAPFLTIGPWTHTDPAAAAAAIREGLAWFDAHL